MSNFGDFSRTAETNNVKIGEVHSLYDGELPWRSGAPISFGQFVSRQDAPPGCPIILFRFPIRKPVTAIVWRAPLATGGFHASAQVFDWSKLPTVGRVGEFAGEFSGAVPQHATVYAREATANKNAMRPWEYMIELAEEYWEPLLRLKAAAKLIPAVLSMSEDERAEFAEELGQSRNQKKRLTWREDFFIASRWATWERHRGDGIKSYKHRVADMAKHGLPMSVDAFKKRISRLRFPKLYQE